MFKWILDWQVLQECFQCLPFLKAVLQQRMKGNSQPFLVNDQVKLNKMNKLYWQYESTMKVYESVYLDPSGPLVTSGYTGWIYWNSLTCCSLFLHGATKFEMGQSLLLTYLGESTSTQQLFNRRPFFVSQTVWREHHRGPWNWDNRGCSYRCVGLWLMGQSFPTMLASLHVRWAFNGHWAKKNAETAAGGKGEEDVAGNDWFLQDIIYVNIHV